MTIYEKIDKLCKESGIVISNLGAAIGIELSKSTISNWRKGIMPRNSTLKKIADYFDVPVSYFTDDDAPVAQNKINVTNIFPTTRERYPLLGEIVCGTPTFADQTSGEYVESLAHIDADFCLKAKGESMIYAGIKDGDIVFIKSESIVDNGEIAAVVINDEATLKRVYYYPDKAKLLLLPENPYFEPIVLLGEELNTVKILGRAVAVTSFLRRR